MKTKLKAMGLLCTVIIGLTTACKGNDRFVMKKQIEEAESALVAIDVNNVSGPLLKEELVADKKVLQEQAFNLKSRVKELDHVEHGKFAEEKKLVQEEIDKLALSATKLKGRVMRIQTINAVQAQIDELQTHIDDMKVSVQSAKGDVVKKYQEAIKDLEQQKTQTLTHLDELTANIKNDSEDIWESLKNVSEEAWAATKSKAEALRKSLKNML